MKSPVQVLLGSAVAVVLAAGCSDDPATSTPTTTVADEYQRLGGNLGQTLAQIKSSATTAGPVTPADFASVARVPKAVTGGVDIGAEQDGKSGEKAANVDAVGGDEQVSVFVPDVKSGSGTTATAPSFAAWKGDADSGDNGLCYLAFAKGASWFIVSKCGDGSGAWVCQVTSSETVCNACNTAGECATCDVSQSKLTCAW